MSIHVVARLAAVLEGLGDIGSYHGCAFVEAGDGPSDASDLVCRPSRQRETIDRSLEKAACVGAKRAEVYLRICLDKKPARADHPLANGGRRLTGSLRPELGEAQSRHRHVQVYAIEQRSADARSVALDDMLGTGAPSDAAHAARVVAAGTSPRCQGAIGC